MADPHQPYARLTRNAAGLGAYTSLWLGEDHLMTVISTGYNDGYSRVQLRDIKAFFITSGNRRLWLGVAWSVFTAVPGLVVLDAVVSGTTPVFSTVFFAIGIIGLVWNHLLGPGCHVYVMTAVQTARLPALVRRKKANQVLARLQPLIEAAQADLGAELAAWSGSRPPMAAGSATPGVPPPVETAAGGTGATGSPVPPIIAPAPRSDGLPPPPPPPTPPPA